MTHASPANGAEPIEEKRIDKLFQIMVKQGASDLHLKVGEPPIMRVRGNVAFLKSEPLTNRQVEKLVFELLSDDMQRSLAREGGIDLAHEFTTDEGPRRCRVAVFRQRNHISLAARLVQAKIPSFEDIHVPPHLADVAMHHQGLILVCGATGSGKSTTLAALIGHINRNRRCHILTVEDPIEFAFEDDKSFINQREMGIDVFSWQVALKQAMRADPDVIMVGEMRDPDTFHAGVTAAETGHLVFGTVHASSTSQTISRILDMFPRERHRMLRQELAQHLRAIICQMLVPAAIEGVSMVPAVEIMINTPAIRNLILKEEDRKIADLLPTCRDQGMQDMVQALADLVNKDMVLRRIALEYAPNRDRLEMALRGISTGGGGLVG